jgi:hypothetical protein
MADDSDSDAVRFLALADHAGYDAHQRGGVGQVVFTGRGKSEGILAHTDGSLRLWPKIKPKMTLEQARQLLGVRGGPMVSVGPQILVLEPWNDPPVMWRAPFELAGAFFWLLAWPKDLCPAPEDAVPLPDADGPAGDPGGRKNWVGMIVPHMDISFAQS